MADRQTTGGYPKIGEIASVDLPVVAQAKPDDLLYFRKISLSHAQHLYIEMEENIKQLKHGIANKYYIGGFFMHIVDLNCDMGESFGAYQMGNDLEILDYVTSANIACGFHAGDPSTMRKTVRMALEKNVGIGAHPGFQDLVGFGRREMHLSPQEVQDIIIYQIGALYCFCESRRWETATCKTSWCPL